MSLWKCFVISPLTNYVFVCACPIKSLLLSSLLSLLLLFFSFSRHLVSINKLQGRIADWCWHAVATCAVGTCKLFSDASQKKTVWICIWAQFFRISINYKLVLPFTNYVSFYCQLREHTILTMLCFNFLFALPLICIPAQTKTHFAALLHTSTLSTGHIYLTGRWENGVEGDGRPAFASAVCIRFTRHIKHSCILQTNAFLYY